MSTHTCMSMCVYGRPCMHVCVCAHDCIIAAYIVDKAELVCRVAPQVWPQSCDAVTPSCVGAQVSGKFLEIHRRQLDTPCIEASRVRCQGCMSSDVWQGSIRHRQPTGNWYCTGRPGLACLPLTASRFM